MIIYVVSKVENKVSFISEDIVKAFLTSGEATRFMVEKSAEVEDTADYYFITEVELV